MSITKMIDLDLTNKRVFIRSDLNIPIKNNKIISDMRIIASMKTIKTAIQKGAKVIVASHLGNPIEGLYDKNLSMQFIANYLSKKINYPILFKNNYLNGINISNKELIVLENVRFNKGEKKDEEFLAKQYASLCDIYVMDAFGSAHRTHASTHNVAKFSSIACTGELLDKEIKTLSKILNNLTRPVVAIIAGSKISTKLKILCSLVKIVDQLIVGGGIANTFIASKGNYIGNSLYEENMIPKVKKMIEKYQVIIPSDVCVATEFSETAKAIIKSTSKIKNNEIILDLGPKSIENIINSLKSAKTIIWNGPVGVFEFTNFKEGTKTIAKAIAKSNAFSIVGGGDTLAVIESLNISNKISYISTGGGAFLEFISGKELPAITMLKKCTKYN
ncbi:Phosphoglycerate kinase [Candidatus Providencia siddallii]|uniref:Phosphoglycerate kinase n=1 Tax=Candidatus Providencia siddallii TaxID=1715285 RepID=A0A0M6W819_9GAMM|nr:Phosphoglycerate kinase [Candidatus Providencia siddallii]